MVLMQGMTGQKVRDLQAVLNARLNPSPELRITGLFDSATAQALQFYQAASWLEVDGIAGPATLDALNGEEAEAPARHHLPYVPQSDPHTGWAAATAMLRHTPVVTVRQMTPSRFLNGDGDLISDGAQRMELHRAFAGQHGLRYRPPKNWPVSTLVGLLRTGPVMIESLRRPSLQRNGTTSRFVVVVGLRGSNRPDGQSTTMRIHDPDQNRSQGSYSITLANFGRAIPTGGFALFST